MLVAIGSALLIGVPLLDDSGSHRQPEQRPDADRTSRPRSAKPLAASKRPRTPSRASKVAERRSGLEGVSPIAIGRFHVTEKGLKLPSTVTLFLDRERTRGYQIPRGEAVDVLAIEESENGSDYDLVNVRAGARSGWILRMQFEAIDELDEADPT